MIHAAVIPMPDKAGRTQNCQACHPTHWYEEKMNEETNPYRITDSEGTPRFSNADVRTAGGGCYLRRDAHTNPEVKPPFFLNEIGKWYFQEVSMKDENNKAVSGVRGLYCSNCHNELAHELYKHDDLKDAARQEGATLRNKQIGEVIKTVANGDEKKFKAYFADPVVGAEGDPLKAFYEKHSGATMVKATKDSAGKLRLLPWNAGRAMRYPMTGHLQGKTGGWQLVSRIVRIAILLLLSKVKAGIISLLTSRINIRFTGIPRRTVRWRASPVTSRSTACIR